jgi:hypothetical protein
MVCRFEGQEVHLSTLKAQVLQDGSQGRQELPD